VVQFWRRVFRPFIPCHRRGIGLEPRNAGQYQLTKPGRGRSVARKPTADERQPNFFGNPPPAPAKPDTRGRQSRSGTDSLDTRAAPLSQAELTEFAAGLPDNALAHLVIVAVRELRHRLARIHRHAGKRRSSTLERAAGQLAAELGGEGRNEDA
jgi:hypothetical protein